ncbi:hypothetical protein ACOSP7_013841 [Xanthoceras sorbifolium]
MDFIHANTSIETCHFSTRQILRPCLFGGIGMGLGFFFSKPMFGATKWVWLKLTSLHFIPSKRDKCNPSKTRVKKIQSTFLSNSSPTLFSLLSPPLSPTP